VVLKEEAQLSRIVLSVSFTGLKPSNPSWLSLILRRTRQHIITYVGRAFRVDSHSAGLGLTYTGHPELPESRRSISLSTSLSVEESSKPKRRVKKGGSERSEEPKPLSGVHVPYLTLRLNLDLIFPISFLLTLEFDLRLER